LRAMRRGRPHQAITDFRLCKEFGWTIQQLEQQPAKKLQEFLVVLGEMDKQTQEEMEKAKRQTGSVRGFT
jgi:hypothetical protein